MCTTCGCDKGEARIEGAHQHTHVHADGTVHTHSHDHSDQHAHSDHHHRHDHSHGHRHADGTVHSHPHDHHHEHDHRELHYGAGPAAASAPGISQARMVQIEQDILSKNDELAAVNRKRLAERGIFAVNLVSSPGSGKTTLLVKTIEALKGKHEVVVIEGDQETSYDADRIRSTGARALQINTGKGCHLDADMVGQAVQQLAPPAGCVLMIENVGNLVCPAGFDLGEAHRVVVLSVTEGEDKPLKYPEMFRRSTLMLLNKIDLLQHVDFDIAKCVEYARRVNPNIRVIEVSATKGHGMADWLAWISDGVADARRARHNSIGTLQARVAELEDEIRALRSTLR